MAAVRRFPNPVSSWGEIARDRWRWGEIDHTIRNARDPYGEHVDTPAHRRSAGRMAAARARAQRSALAILLRKPKG